MGEWRHFTFSARFGAYGDWLIEPGSNYEDEYDFTSVAQYPVLAMSSAADVTSAAPADGLLDGLIHPTPEQGAFSYLEAGQGAGMITGTADLETLTRLANEPDLSAQVNRIIVSQKLPEDAYCGQVTEPAESERQENEPCDPGTVVVGIVDEGMAFANHRFRKSNERTRIEYFWMQDGRCRPDRCSPAGYGREMTRQDIDRCLARHIQNGNLDEDRFYSDIGLLDFTRPGHKAAAFRVSHGTHIMDIAAGHEPGSTLGPNGSDKRPIVGVQLPTATVADTSGIGLEKFLLDGVRYILDRALRIAAQRGTNPLPVVINFSSAVFAGPHDGNHDIERGVNALLTHYERVHRAKAKMVVPAGNHYLSGTHAKLELAGVGNQDSKGVLTWQIQPDDTTFSFVELWLPATVDHEHVVAISIIPPGSEESIALDTRHSGMGIAWEPVTQNGAIVCKVYYEEFANEPASGNYSTSTSRGRFVIAVAPSAPRDSPVPVIPSGSWKIRLANHSARKQVVHTWIQWDGNPITYPISGRQSYFVDRNAEGFDPVSGRVIETDKPESTVKRFGTISAIATSPSFITVAGFTMHDVSCTPYSSAGERTEDGVPGPDLACVTDDSFVHSGILGTGSKSGSVTALNGTSVAAPQVTRKIADLLSEDPDMDVESQLREFALENERMIENGSIAGGPALDQNPYRPAPSEPRIGAGRLVADYPMVSRPSQRWRQPIRR